MKVFVTPSFQQRTNVSGGFTLVDADSDADSDYDDDDGDGDL